MTKKIAVLPGDGIGPEVVAEAVKVLHCLRRDFGLDVELEQALFGGAAYDAYGSPLPDSTLALAKAADAVLLGAVGGPKWEPLDIALRPEKALLMLRSELELFANLRPALLYPQLAEASSLKPEVVSGLDIMIVRELIGGIYFGQPRGVRTLPSGERQGYNTLVYSESEIERIAARETQELERREQVFRAWRPPLDVEGKTVVLVDDGIATGASIRVAIAALRQKRPAEIVVAAPVVPLSTYDRLRREADDVICVHAPKSFYAIGEFYDDFSQVTDEEVIELLRQASSKDPKDPRAAPPHKVDGEVRT